MQSDGSAVILAGGQGRRIGYDKKQLVLNGEMLIDRLIDFLQKEFHEVLVSSNNEFKRQGICVVKDMLGAGPLAGIYSALKTTVSPYLYVCACDMPFISSEHINQLKKAMQETSCDVAAARRPDGFIEPLNAMYRASCLPVIEKQLQREEYKPALLFSKMQVYTINVYPEKEFFNINYAEDLQNAEKAL